MTYPKRVTVCREAHFNAAHRLHSQELSDQENAEIFGLCNNPFYHGHNYKLVVSVTGEVDERTGYVIDMKVVKDLIKELVENKFDHKNLNEQVFEFNPKENPKALNPTAENIARIIYADLKPCLKPYDLNITLYETERNFVQCGDA